MISPRIKIIGIFTVVIVVAMLTALLFSVFTARGGDECPAGRAVLALRGDIAVSLAKTDEEHERGLSGHAPLGENEGMFFVFPRPQMMTFWMKDMLFPIDIIWLDQDVRVVGIVEDATPASYPALFQSPPSTQHVLEVRSGFARERGIQEGDKAELMLCGAHQ